MAKLIAKTVGVERGTRILNICGRQGIDVMASNSRDPSVGTIEMSRADWKTVDEILATEIDDGFRVVNEDGKWFAYAFYEHDEILFAEGWSREAVLQESVRKLIALVRDIKTVVNRRMS